MRFILIVKASGYSEAGIKHSREQNDAMVAYKKSLARAGALIATEKLQPSSRGIRIMYPLHGGKPEVKAGPFPVDQELIAEYTLIDVRTEDEAIDWALRMPVPVGRSEWRIELRLLEEYSEPTREPRIQTMEVDLQDQLNMLKNI